MKIGSLIADLDTNAESMMERLLPPKFDTSIANHKIYYKLYDEMDGIIYSTLLDPIFIAIEKNNP